MNTLRRHRLDGFLVALAIAEFVGQVLSGNPGRYLAAALAAVATLSLLLRRRAPLLVSIAAFALLAGSLMAAPKSPSVQFFGLMATFAVVAAVNSTRSGIIAGLAGAVLVGIGTGTSDVGSAGTKAGDFVLTIAFCSVMWVAGWLISRHTRRADVMELRARGAEQAQLIALREERARIARELHDVVSHGLSVVVLQTLAARSALEDARAAEVERHLDAVESTARDALGEMRRMLGLLQIDDLEDAEPAAPSPGLRHLGALIERARATGLIVDDSAVDVNASLSSGVELAIYRIVQEALTNCAKHAAHANVRVVVRAADAGSITVEIVDDGGRSAGARLVGAGHGLVGMRERVALYGGTLQAASQPHGGFAVRATLCTDSVPAAAARR